MGWPCFVRAGKKESSRARIDGIEIPPWLVDSRGYPGVKAQETVPRRGGADLHPLCRVSGGLGRSRSRLAAAAQTPLRFALVDDSAGHHR